MSEWTKKRLSSSDNCRLSIEDASPLECILITHFFFVMQKQDQSRSSDAMGDWGGDDNWESVEADQGEIK